jgi:hypothetical protein
MMTIQQTVEIPASRKVHFDVSLPEDTPQGNADMRASLNRGSVRDARRSRGGGLPIIAFFSPMEYAC